MSDSDKILSAIAELAAKIDNLEARFDKLEGRVDAIDTNLKIVMQHQIEDYALLKSVDEKVSNLASLSEEHEEKFQKLKAL